MTDADSPGDTWIQTAAHWGVYDVNPATLEVRPFAKDLEPSPIGYGMGEALEHDLRIRQPMIRRGWLEGGGRRGADEFVAVDWDFALDKAAAAIGSVIADHGNEAVFGGSYGWGSAGRFNHPQSQIHRFFNLLGGYVSSVNTYSTAAMEVILPHVLCTQIELFGNMPTWTEIEREGRFVVAFGGLALKNTQVNSGGVSRHTARQAQRACHAAGVRFVNIGPIRGDVDDALEARWLPARPNSDTAIMLALAHVLVTEDLYDREFVERGCVGFDVYRDYLTGAADGQPKTPAWAAALSGLDEADIRNLAHEIARNRTLITVSWSIQRADHGEQPYWAAIALAALSGSMGKPGGGFGAGYGAVHGIGSAGATLPVAPFPQGVNPIKTFIPVARISDMLLNPGAPFDYDGTRYSYPDIRLVYWCGGNPFHHHQDLRRLVEAWQKPETIIVNEPWWNALARHADIVFPATTALERNDFATGRLDGIMTAMKQVRPPVPGSRNDFEIFTALSERLGLGQTFTEGRGEMEWIKEMYAGSQVLAAQYGFTLPGFDEFWETGEVICPLPEGIPNLFQQFRKDPERFPLSTDTGKLNLWSARIASFGYADCPPHPTWLEPAEWLGSAKAREFPFHLTSNQPTTRLHSQYDHVGVSSQSKVKGREPATLHPADAASHGIAEGDIVRIFNDRGSCFAAARLNDAMIRGVIQLPTGSWYDPAEPGVRDDVCVHGNPNVLTRDKGTSSLAQGPSAHSCLVDIEKWQGEPPELRITRPPKVV